MASVLALLAGVSLGAQAVDSGLVARLTSGDVGTRMQAVQELQGAVAENPYTLKEETLRDAAIKSLELENALVAADFRRVTQGQGERQLQEAYSEHYAALLGIADQIQREAPPDNPLAAARLFRALVFGSYNPQSEFVSSLAMAGEPIVPHVLELAKGPFAENAYALTAALLQSHDRGALRKPLSATSAHTLRAHARSGLQHPNEEVKHWAISAVVAARDRGAIPVLRRLADRTPGSDDPSVTYMRQAVRDSARDAVATLERIRQ